MSRAFRIFLLFILCIASLTTLVNASGKNIVIEIDYGGVKPSRTIEVPWLKDRTALELLQAVSEVKTHPVGQYVFVVSVDGIEGKRGDMAWYYEIDGKSADKLAYSNVLDSKVSNIKWAYKKDVCSAKVDKKI